MTLAGTANYTVTNADITTLTVSSTGTAAITTQDLGVDDAGAIVISGGGNATVTGGGSGDTLTITGLATAGQTFTGTVSKFNVTGGLLGQAITTGGAVDTIDGGAGNDTITGGAGADGLTGGLGADVFVFSGSTTALNGADTIADFAVAQGDVLSFASVLTSGAIANATVGTAITLASTGALATEGTSIAVATNKVYVAQVTTAATIDTAGKVITALTDTGVLDAVDFAASAHSILILSGADALTTFYVYGIDNDGTAAIAGGELVLIGIATADTVTLLTTSFGF